MQLLLRRRDSCAWFFSLIKVAGKKTDNCIQRFLLVNTARYNSQCCSTTRSERQNAQDRFSVGFLGVSVEALKREAAFEPARHAYEVGGSACVKSEAAGDLESGFSHFQLAPVFDGGASKAPAL